MCDLMPRFVHDALDKVECPLSLVALVVVVICTLQFAFTHFMHIACIVSDILRKRARRGNRCPKPRKVSNDDCCSLIGWIIGIINCFMSVINSWFKSQCADKCPRKPKACKRKCPKKKCSNKTADFDDDLFDDADDLLGIEEL